jgi:xanthine dehydrogenase YagR molybdenum-binding subunit
VYPSDTHLPDTLYGAILGCPYPNAIVKGLDLSEAKKMAGVRAIIDNSDPLANLKWPYSNDIQERLFDPHCRFEGEAIAAVAAETPYQAWDALRAIKVEYEVLPFTVDEKARSGLSSPRGRQSCKDR